VVITGGSFTDTVLSTGALDSDLQITGAVFTDAKVAMAAANLHFIRISATKFVVTDSFTAGGAMITMGGSTGNYLDLDDVTFYDKTTTAAYQSFVTVNGATLRASGIKTLGTSRATLGVMYVNGGVTGTVDNSIINGNINLAGGGPSVDTWGGSNNLFLGTGHFSGASTLQQRFVRRMGVNPVAVASAASIDTNVTAWLSYDTQVITGAAAIANLTSPYPCAGTVKLVVATGGTWSTANSGNILPLTTAARTAGTVVVLLWEPTAAKWLEQ